MYALRIIEEAGENDHAYINNNMIDMFERHWDLQLYKTDCYYCSRFSRSFEDTLTFMLPGSRSDQLKHARSLAMNIFYTKATPTKAAEEVLHKLISNGYSLAIITAGEEWVQKRRLDDFHLRSLFQICEILEQKTDSRFRDFCDRNKVDVSSSWMIGDSVRSDILPAQAAGLHVIHVESPNWSAEHEKIPDGVESVSTISGVIPIILGDSYLT
jgi:putative hydrolase of the HAD superfamily